MTTCVARIALTAANPPANAKFTVSNWVADQKSEAEMMAARGTENHGPFDFARDVTRLVTGVNAAASTAENVSVKYIVREFAAWGLPHTTTHQTTGIVTFQIPGGHSHVMAELPAVE